MPADQTQTTAKTLLDVQDLCVSFRSEGGLIRILENVSFTVREREILAIVGESGSGKSMTSLAVMRLITDPNAVITGSIRYKGRDLLQASEREMRSLRGSDIAMIFQDPMTAMTPVYTIGWQIEEQLRAHQKLSRRAARARAVELLGEMGVPSPAKVAGRYPHQLSGGLRQRAMIAMALSCNPSLLIADEPTTALDVTVQAQILELIQRLRADFGSSVIFITHDMGVVATVSDRVMVMYAGIIAERGPKPAVLGGPQHPYTLGLLHSIPPMHGVRPHRLPSIPGSPPAPMGRPAGCAFQPRCDFRMDICATRPPLFHNGTQEASCWLAEKGAPDWARERAIRAAGDAA
ncbi:MAG TPA: ABC transporter ATP-binding protein [Acidisoma sp.]|jgi:peptide/nickel transport system ATP-binding protein|uniref:ABC transporter ATP-binding protein n=1 Tax=Acidisoma sp. TaxID=1872115 RepID=UPI002C81A7EB|nr:ABC transporter ATP-binding protein [Acidisoma sp.]HTI00184.1 ABC transporter ATP-binding protein [Acidisoma sp.]